MINGYYEYDGYFLQQNPKSKDLIPKFINESNPSRILEIGTSHGGLTYLLKKHTSIPIISVDIDVKDNRVYENSNFYKKDIFDNLFLKNIILPYIKKEGRTIVFCDGGNKIKEFNYFSTQIKDNDLILAHDYFTDMIDFHENGLNKEWNWCEITEDDITTSTVKNNLIVEYEYLKRIQWVCKRKTSQSIKMLF